MAEPYRFRDVVVEAGTRKQFWPTMYEHSDGSTLQVPVVILHGQHPGDVLYVGAGVHGDEINIVLGTLDALKEIDPKDVHGTIFAVTVQNPYGYRARRRLVDINQSDSETMNVHRQYPGNPDGDPHQRMAHFLYRLVKDSGANFMIDLHTGTTGSYCPPHTFIPGPETGQAAVEALAAAEAFNVGHVIQATGGTYAHGGMPHTVLSAEGLPVLGCEMGTGGYVDESLVAGTAEGLLRVLRHRGVLRDGGPAETAKQNVYTDVVYVRANRGGLFEPRLQPGVEVEEGEVVGNIVDVFGDVVEVVKAPMAGNLVQLTTLPTLHVGERVCRVARA